MAEGLGETDYHLMKSYHDKAYAVISEALDLDESGQGQCRESVEESRNRSIELSPLSFLIPSYF